MARNFDGSVEAYVAPIAKTVKIRGDKDPRFSGSGNVFTNESVNDLYNTMLSAAEKLGVTVSVFCPDIEKGRKGGYTVAELKALDMDVYNVQLKSGYYGPYVAVLKPSENDGKAVAKTLVL